MNGDIPRPLSIRQKRLKRLSLLLIFCFCAAWAITLLSATASHTSDTRQKMFKVGFSSATFTEVNHNDVMAALKVWARMMAKERAIPTDPQPLLLNGLEAIRQGIQNRLVDAVALNTDEYWKLRDELDKETCIVGLNEGRPTEEYILLTHKDSGIKRIADLRGRRLFFFQSPRTSLAPYWLDTVLAQGGFRRTAEFCQITNVPKLQSAVLPVFFRQIDACVVTLRGFRTMAELNPQMSQQLRVIASSPAMVPALFAFRHDYNDPTRNSIIKELGLMMSTPSGAQFLTLFQTGSLKASSLACLDNALELLSRHNQLCGQTSTVRTRASNKERGRPK